MKEAPERTLLQHTGAPATPDLLNRVSGLTARFQEAQVLVSPELFLTAMTFSGEQKQNFWALFHMDREKIGAGDVYIPVYHCSSNRSLRGVTEMATINSAQLKASDIPHMYQELRTVFGVAEHTDFIVLQSKFLGESESVVVQRLRLNGQKTDGRNNDWRARKQWIMEDDVFQRLSLVELLLALERDIPQFSFVPQSARLLSGSYTIPDFSL